MTTPITPNPAIHNDSINIQALEEAALQELRTLTQILETFANQIILMVVNALLNAFGLGAFAGPIDGVISEFERLMEAIPSGNIQAILGSIDLGADIQAIVDSIANALGIGGVGHDLATLISALEAIPSGNVAAILGSLNLGADVQAIVDKLANAWGFAGTGHTLTNLLSYAQSIPSAVITNVLGSTNLGADVQAIVDKLANAWGFAGTGHSLTQLLSYAGAIPGSVISGFTAIESAINSELISLEGEIVGVLNGAGSGFLAVGAALNSIPFVNVIAPFFTNIGASIQGFVDAIASAFAQASIVGSNPSEAAQAATEIVNVVNSTQAIANAVAQTIENQAITNPAFWGIDQTASASFNILSLNGTTAPTVSLTQAGTVACYIDTPSGGVKESVAWLGDGTITGFNAFYINVYKVNTATGVATWIWSSNNIISAISGGAVPLWNYANIPVAKYINSQQGYKYVAEFQVLGTGTYNIVGINGHWLNQNTSVTVGNVGCKRTSGSCIAQTSLARFNAAGNFAVSTKNPTWAHAYQAGDTVVVGVSIYSSASAVTGVTATIGGVAMTQLGLTANYETTGFGYIAVFGALSSALSGLSTGSQTVAITTTGGGTSGSACSAKGTSSSYTNISAFGTVQTTSGSSATPSQTVTGLTANSSTIIYSVLATDIAAGTGWTNSNQNSIAFCNSASVSDAMMIQDQLAYATSVVFNGSAASSARFGGVAVPMTCTVTNPLQVPSSTFTPTASNNIPWAALCGSAGISQIQTTTKQFKSAGANTYTVPTAAQAAAAVGATVKFDIVVLGAGGGGLGWGGTGGGTGSWTTITLTYGTDIPLSTTSFTVSVGTGGFGGIGNLGAAGNGTSTTVTITGHGTVNSNGGTGGAGSASQTSWGASAGNIMFDGAPYYGGVEEPQLGYDGYAPGGGGAAGDPSFFGNGGAGAPGYASITCYQV